MAKIKLINVAVAVTQAQSKAIERITCAARAAYHGSMGVDYKGRSTKSIRSVLSFLKRRAVISTAKGEQKHGQG